ncbi:hypothetical protein [Agromyces sp. S2-1-8]|uniref:hypothetical protein n=1 Tax=Agromyces sp. S2-1-8 TaxID=2897180 RepID=UPI001E458A75|nr:hypothetical protein [Agromyces sp. S2-1-8]MCD5346734.1 hypothetical protein [Agromyces sp. S2-1-8]
MAILTALVAKDDALLVEGYKAVHDYMNEAQSGAEQSLRLDCFAMASASLTYSALGLWATDTGKDAAELGAWLAQYAGERSGGEV